VVSCVQHWCVAVSVCGLMDVSIMFLCVFNQEFLVERWDRCGRLMEGVVNGWLTACDGLVYCDGICVPPVYEGMWLYQQLGEMISCLVGIR
jgi:hypothetical protein